MSAFTAEQAAAFRIMRQHLADVRSAEAVALRTNEPHSAEAVSLRKKEGRSVSAERPSAQADARSAKASAERRAASTEPLADVVRDTAGIQSQVMSAAEMSMWTRRQSTTRVEIQRALWDTRDLVRTSAMRLTLHVIPARDFAIYIEALKPMALVTLQRWHARVGAKPGEVRGLIDTVVDSLRDQGPQTQQELIARVRRKAGKGVRTWLDHAWSAIRPAVIDGAIVYGPPRGAEATFIHTDGWLGPQPRLSTDEARAELMRRFLSAFGPASPHDFARWSGLKTTEAKAILTAIERDVQEVDVDGARGWALRSDVAAIASSRIEPDAVRLLPAFDSFLLAHATKEHLVERRFYERVYRPQGWISPTVLQRGRVIGVWFQQAAGRNVTLDVQLFKRARPHVREAIAAEADALGIFLGRRCTPRFTTTPG